MRATRTNKANVPADLHELLSAAKNRPELSIRIYDPITSYLTSPHTFNANIALNLSLLTFIIQRYFKRIRRSLYSIPAERRSAGTLKSNANVVRATRTNKANVPADLHELLSAAKNRPELSIRIYDPITSYLTSPHTFNANIALNLSLLTS